jgi:K+-sensing histidine kinase KdpD
MQRREFITFLGAAAAGWKRAKRPTALLREAGYLFLGLVSLATVTGLYFWLDVPLVAAAFTYLVVLVLLSLVTNLSSLIVLSFIGVGCLSYFFAPPIYSFRVGYPQDLITISAFVITSFVVNFLVTRVRGEQRDHMRTCETLRDANQRLEVTNKALRIESVERKGAEQALRELVEQQTAISEVLRAIASSPHDLQPIFDAIIGNARHLCQAEVGVLRLSEQAGLRLVAANGDLPWSLPELLEHSSYIGQFAASLSPVHIPDQAAHELYRRGDPYILTSVNVGGFRTALFVPMVKDENVIGVLSVARTHVQPFTDKQIELVTDFAAQAAIALQFTRREREYRQVQNELAHANRVATMGQLTASIAHELKQPLSAAMIGGDAGLNWLMRHPPEIEKAKQSVEQMVADVNRASVIIDRIHSLVKKHAPQMEKLDINGAILEVVGLIQSEVVKNGVTARMELAESLPHVQGDRVQLQQVILNLMINSIQAMSDLAGGERELHVTTELIASEGVRVGVRDSGPGFSAENLQRLFAPFYTTKPNGMGMGLSICRSMIEDHGGRLWASRIDPQGALFQFTIPVT